MIIPEEFPEGPYGSPLQKEEPVKNKSTKWKKGQHRTSPFRYPNNGLQRQIPGAYPVEDSETTEH